MQTDKKYLFEQERPGKALAIMALPTIISQMIVLLYNLADTWYIGRINGPDMVGVSTLAVTLYLAVVAMSNVFGIGGGTTVLSIPTRIEKIGTENVKALYSVGLPAALSIFLFDVVTIALNKMIVEYGNIPLAAMGIALKVERLPMYIGIGIGNFIVHYMNAVGKGKVSLVLAVIRHLVLILPVMLIMNAASHLTVLCGRSS
ncbi:MAG: hypothetical protein K6C38_04260 [Saccharofermentans sp.]|nr:hypothetical protein [Saccharofermentans sp.]